jgi:predicted HicB family RNase H-like nuclease
MPAPENNQNAVKEAADKASSFLYIRANPTDKSAWVRASNRSKTKLSKWVTETLNTAAEKVLSQPNESDLRKVVSPLPVPNE